jgi:hypothetical protein
MTLLIWLICIAVYLIIGCKLGKRQIPRLMAKRDAECKPGTMGWKYANDNMTAVVIWMAVAWPIVWTFMFAHRQLKSTVASQDKVWQQQVLATKQKALAAEDKQRAEDAAEVDRLLAQSERELQKVANGGRNK